MILVLEFAVQDVLALKTWTNRMQSIYFLLAEFLCALGSGVLPHERARRAYATAEDAAGDGQEDQPRETSQVSGVFGRFLSSDHAAAILRRKDHGWEVHSSDSGHGGLHDGRGADFGVASGTESSRPPGLAHTCDRNLSLRGHGRPLGRAMTMLGPLTWTCRQPGRDEATGAQVLRAGRQGL